VTTFQVERSISDATYLVLFVDVSVRVQIEEVARHHAELRRGRGECGGNIGYLSGNMDVDSSERYDTHDTWFPEI